jgi:hypothetical protein
MVTCPLLNGDDQSRLPFPFAELLTHRGCVPTEASPQALPRRQSLAHGPPAQRMHRPLSSYAAADSAPPSRRIELIGGRRTPEPCNPHRAASHKKVRHTKSTVALPVPGLFQTRSACGLCFQLSCQYGGRSGLLQSVPPQRWRSGWVVVAAVSGIKQKLKQVCGVRSSSQIRPSFGLPDPMIAAKRGVRQGITKPPASGVRNAASVGFKNNVPGAYCSDQGRGL